MKHIPALIFFPRADGVRNFARRRTAAPAAQFQSRMEISTGRPFAAPEAVAYDDSKWNTVGLPHSFSIAVFPRQGFLHRLRLVSENILMCRRHGCSKRVFVEFDGAFQDAEVFVNGRSAGRHRGGYTGFSCDITPALHAGRNLLAVRLNNNWSPTLAPRGGRSYFSRRDLSRCLAGGDRAAARHLVWHLRHDAGGVAANLAGRQRADGVAKSRNRRQRIRADDGNS
jgi:hypothetical protein